MDENKNNPALEALGVSATPPAWDWTDTLEKRIWSLAALATEELREGRSAVRLRYAQMAELSSLLSQYYAFLGEAGEERAKYWRLRADRYHTRAFKPLNKIARNIGGVME